MSKFIIEKVDGFIKSCDELKPDTYFFSVPDDRRLELSKKIQGFLRGAFGDERVKIYLSSISFDERLMTNKDIYFEKLKRMKNFLISLKEEAEVKHNLGLDIKNEVSIDNVLENAEKSQKEAERRKNVAEFKYWGFAIELIETVRREIKEFRKFQEELLNEIKNLKEDIKSITKKT